MGGEPILVHGSAGIGPAGVLVIVETAMCLTERNPCICPWISSGKSETSGP